MTASTHSRDQNRECGCEYGNSGRSNSSCSHGNTDGKSRYIQLVAVQMHASPEDYKTAQAFQDKIDQTMQKVCSKIDRSIPTLVVFPEDAATMTALTGMNVEYNQSPLGDAIEKIIKRNIVKLAPVKLRYKLLKKDVSWLGCFFLSRGSFMRKIYIDTFSDMARKYQVYIVAGSTLLPYDSYQVDRPGIYRNKEYVKGGIYNVCYVFDPAGSVVGGQRKVHLIDMEMENGLGLTPAKLDEIEVIKTPIGNIGAAICFDAFHEDVLDILQEKGANILVQPSANPGPWTYEQQLDWLTGCYKAVCQEKRFQYAVNPMLNGSILDVSFYGQSSILSRDGEPALSYSQMEPAQGMEAVAETADREEILVLKVPNPNGP